MQPAAQMADARQQSGSRVPPNGAHKLSLLGQQLTHFPGSSQQSQAVAGAPSAPPASNTVSLHGFPSNGHIDPLSLPPAVQAHFQTHLAGANGFQTPLHPWQAYNLQMSSQMAQSLPESVHTHDLSRTVHSPSLVNVVAVLQQKIEQLQAHVQSIVQAGQSNNASMAHQQTVMAARLASSISQLALTMAGMLPSPQQHTFTFQAMPQYTDLQFSHLFGGPLGPGLNFFQQGGNALGSNPGNSLGNLAGGDDDENRLVDRSDDMAVDNGPSRPGRQGKNSQATSASNGVGAHGVSTRHTETKTDGGRENHDMQKSAAATNGGTEDVDSGAGSREDEDDGETEDLVPGTYDLVEMNAVEILAEHTHFCDICGKGFKRDANLRMHMRGHGDEYKTAAALARPDRYSQDPSVVRPRRYSCPYVGCKRNKKHRKFQPLKTVLCVKNHYRRSHCPKSLTCGKCKSKKFSVVADLKTHEKHCGREKWLCSCGTTFSRKDKLLGHIGLFQGHKPALPLHEMEGSVNPGDTAGNLRACNGNKGPAVEPMDESGFSSPKAMKSVKGSDEKMISSSDSPRSRSSLQVQGGTSLLQGLFSENFLQNESQPSQHKSG